MFEQMESDESFAMQLEHLGMGTLATFLGNEGAPKTVANKIDAWTGAAIEVNDISYPDESDECSSH